MKTVEPLLGTRAEVSVAAASASGSQRAEDAVIDEVARLEQIFSVFRPASALCELRRVGSTSVPELEVVVELAAEWFETTEGMFNPAIQPLIDLWDDAESAGTMPEDSMLVEAAASLGSSLAMAHLDLNAIAKGWIAQRALALIETEPHVTSGWLNLGGDMVHRGAGSVAVGIENPHRPYDNVPPMATIELSNESLATSGGARRWWTINGRRFVKTLDPTSGQPVEQLASASFVCDSAATADVLATVAIVAPLQQTLGLAADAGAEFFLAHHDGSVIRSSDRFS